MKTTIEAYNQAIKLQTYCNKIAINLDRRLLMLNSKPRLSNVSKRVERMYLKTHLKNQSNLYKDRAKKIFSLFTNNPKYYGWQDKI